MRQGSAAIQRESADASRAVDGRLGGMAAILGALLMIAGAALWASTGADLDRALESGTVAEYLAQAAANKTALSANLGCWMFGVVFLAASGIGFARYTTARPTIAHVALGGYLIGTALALAAFSLWLGLVRELAPAHGAGTDLAATGAALGQAASTADWVATVLIMAVGQGLIAVAGRGQWVPTWLYVWGLLVMLTGLLAIIGLILDARTTWAFAIVPVSLGWALAAGIVALRSTSRST